MQAGNSKVLLMSVIESKETKLEIKDEVNVGGIQKVRIFWIPFG